MGKTRPLDYKWESINPLKEVLTVEKLKSFEGMEHLNDQEVTISVILTRLFRSKLTHPSFTN
jgi:hypothetical protein